MFCLFLFFLLFSSSFLFVCFSVGLGFCCWFVLGLYLFFVFLIVCLLLLFCS